MPSKLTNVIRKPLLLVALWLIIKYKYRGDNDQMYVNLSNWDELQSRVDAVSSPVELSIPIQSDFQGLGSSLVTVEPTHSHPRSFPRRKRKALVKRRRVHRTAPRYSGLTPHPIIGRMTNSHQVMNPLSVGFQPRLLARDQLASLPPTLNSLLSALMTQSLQNVWLDEVQNVSWLNKVKGYVENLTEDN